MDQPWKCPECATWIAPGVAEHRCEPPSAAAAPADPTPPEQSPPTYIPIWVAPYPYGPVQPTPYVYPGLTWSGPGDVVLGSTTMRANATATRGTQATSTTVHINAPVGASAAAIARALERAVNGQRAYFSTASFHSAG